ncbi:MAG: DUF6776 family protein [Pseudomonadota bacterium]|nr:DUF6776 family protein [Pseudomonadota bacterium]
MAKRKSKASGGDLKVVVHRPALTFIWRVLLIVVCLGIWGVGYMVGGWQESQAPIKLLYEEREHLLAKIVEYRKRISDLEIELAQKGVELDIAQESNLKVRDDYRRLYEQMDNLEAQVTHYQRVLKPNAGEQGVVLGLLSMQPTESLTEFNYSVDIFQAIDRRRLTGQADIKLRGYVNGEEKTWDFAALAAKEPLQLKLGFVHFQTLAGTIKLPENVKPVEVIVNAEITGGKSVTLSKAFPWTLKELSDDLEQGEA